MSDENVSLTFNFQNTPMQLINFEKQNFIVNPKAIEMLKSIKEEIIVVSVVGKARTGKSFLMNTLLELNGKSEGVNFIFVIYLNYFFLNINFNT